jgi:L-ascorbate metabolism protein UlaG (beta-lactamase superfamily)
LLFTLVLSTSKAKAQKASPDKIETTKGTLTIQPILHGSVVLTWDKKTIYVDPYGGAKSFAGISSPDMILITDIHGDHMDTSTLNSLQTSKSILVVPQAVADQLPEKYNKQLVVIKNGNKSSQLGISISAIPMYNLPEDPESRHIKGRGNGYILNLGGKTIYLSGDTEDIPEMRSLKNIDIAFICMNLPFTMDINQAANAVLAFKPKIVYPYHYRGQGGLNDIEGFKKIVNKGDKSIEVRLKNWYP